MHLIHFFNQRISVLLFRNRIFFLLINFRFSHNTFFYVSTSCYFQLLHLSLPHTAYLMVWFVEMEWNNNCWNSFNIVHTYIYTYRQFSWARKNIPFLSQEKISTCVPFYLPQSPCFCLPLSFSERANYVWPNICVDRSTWCVCVYMVFRVFLYLSLILIHSLSPSIYLCIHLSVSLPSFICLCISNVIVRLCVCMYVRQMFGTLFCLFIFVEFRLWCH